jgi:hypothetical protein
MHSEFEMNLLTPEVILPGQMSSGARCNADTSGARALILAILEDAVRCIERGRRRRRKIDRQRAEAEAWVRCDNQEWPFSFVSICDVLGIDADALRLRLLADSEAPAGRGAETRAHATPPQTDAHRSGCPRKMSRATAGESLAA